jgi:FtsZ-binding cell division protein ZapB
MTDENSSSLMVGPTLRINPIFHERKFVFDKKLVFILMPFSETWSDRIWEKLKDIITKKELRPERADNRYGAIITEDIWTGIMEARLIVCDTTGWNPNVFYELGIAHTLGKHVILLTQPTNHLPFDTQGLRHFVYTDNPDGMRKLETELPQWIDHCLSLKMEIERITEGKKGRTTDKELRKAAKEAKREAKRLGKTKLKEAWLLNSKGYDPPLPPTEHPVLRSQFGVVKTRMMQYANAFSEEKIEQFVDDLKKVWPDTWAGLSAEEISKKFEEIEEVINSRRSDYRETVQ